MRRISLLFVSEVMKAFLKVEYKEINVPSCFSRRSLFESHVIKSSKFLSISLMLLCRN